MDHFTYRNGQLHAEDVPLEAIAAKVGTPFYVYSDATLRRHYEVFTKAFSDRGLKANVCFAVKANSNLAVLATLAELGCGADVVSEGEIRRAMAAGIPASRIVFSGVGKKRSELVFALEEGVSQINVESEEELHLLSDVASSTGRAARIALRVNPDVDAKTHEKISTGKKENKFGIDIAHAPALYEKARNLPGVEPVSIAVHIGSQLTDMNPYRLAFRRLGELLETLNGMGLGITHLDLGGGLGIPYDEHVPPSPEDYADIVAETIGPLGVEITLEPGRMIVGNAGLLVSEVLFLKKGEAKTFVILDAAMNDLIRPALYNGYHEVVAVKEPAAGAQRTPVDIVGPVCESGDTFAKDRLMPPLEAGDLVAFRSAGAYGAVMSSTYNSRPLVPEILVKGSDWAVVRARQTFEEMLAQDRIAPWLGNTDNRPKQAAGSGSG